MTKTQLATLLTDFGTRDPYVAAIKGVMLSIAPKATLVDISHDVPAHDVMGAAFVLAQSAPYFPRDTVHVVVVDPGVGTDRRILVARYGGQTFIFPDNGVITLIAQIMPLEALFVVRNTEFISPGVSMTFHGRDVIAPLAARILNGMDLATLGPQPDTFKLLEIPAVLEEGREVVGQVIYVDVYGNLITNIQDSMLSRRFQDINSVRVLCGGRDVGPLQGTYGIVNPGEPVVLINSMRLLEVAVNRSRAADVLKCGVGAEVRIALAEAK